MNENHSSDATERVLEDRLRAYYSAQADPAPANLWRRLAPQLEATPILATQPATRATPPLMTLVRSDDESAPPVQPGAKPTRASNRLTHRFMRGVTSVASLVAVLALVVGAFALFHQAPGSGTGGAFHSGALNWRKVALPKGVILTGGPTMVPPTITPVDSTTPGVSTHRTLTPTVKANASLVVAPSDGDIAYVCEIPATGAPLLWRTEDAGQHWTALPSPPDRGYKSGGLTVDRNDPFTVLASFTTAVLPYAKSAYDTYALISGSQQWQPIYGGPVTSDALGNLASWHGVYYSTLLTTFPNGYFRSDLLASTDGMRSWHAIDGQIIAKDTLAPTGESGVAVFLVNPVTGALLAQTYNSTRTGELWMSEDHGANWSEVVLPPSPISEKGETGSWVTGALLWVQTPPVGQSFRLCAWFTEKPNSDSKSFYCSRDSGKTWTRRTPTLQFMDSSATLAPDGAGIGQTSTALYLYPQDDTHLTHPRFIGDLPDAHGGPWDGAQWGVTTRGVTFWAATNANVLYVAQYTLPDL